MKRISNIGFAISLFALTAIIPYCFTKYTLAALGLTTLAAFLWVLAIRSLILYKTFVHFPVKAENNIEENYEIDVDLIRSVWDRERSL